MPRLKARISLDQRPPQIRRSKLIEQFACKHSLNNNKRVSRASYLHQPPGNHLLLTRACVMLWRHKIHVWQIVVDRAEVGKKERGLESVVAKRRYSVYQQDSLVVAQNPTFEEQRRALAANAKDPVKSKDYKQRSNNAIKLSLSARQPEPKAACIALFVLGVGR